MATLVKYRGIDRPRKAGDSGVVGKRGVRIKGAQGPVSPAGTKAARTIGAANAAVTVTALYGGTWANTNVKYAHVVAGTNTVQSVVCAYDSAGILTITLNAATDGGSLSTTTATAGAAAVNADPTASQFVVATAGGTGGSVITASAAAVLSTGAQATPVNAEPLWVRASSLASVVVDVEDGTVQKIVRRNHDRLVSLGLA